MKSTVAQEKPSWIQPAEWDRHSAVWLAWPSHEELWEEALPAVQNEVAELCKAIADPGPDGKPRGERLEIIVPHSQAGEQVKARLAGLDFRIHEFAFGDIWLRDTAPIFVKNESSLGAACFRFNGWGEKYVLPGDAELSRRIAGASSAEPISSSLILEGGSVEVDGEGTCLTTEQCLLNANRNPELSRLQIEESLRKSIGAQTVIWLGDGLLNDHTDGHIDTIARFVAPGKAICMRTEDRKDPNWKILENIYSDLKSCKDAKKRDLEVITIPSPGEILDEDGRLMPASYVNFYISNTAVIVPTYGSPYDKKAVELIGRCFPGRKTLGLSARKILEGGGAFHCITQQQPEVKA